ncbi:citrate lyase [Rhizobium sp. Leaf384]|uniref:HpcH/HpaI aldolase/citrate lyase family protein n=1 Tax=unclassified Rhizobium TaxID=2613769 RepID=UPI000715318B|nr:MULTISPECIES: CoA ester lyase [unclassified Rhizobium]KQS76320.1 citrate lyase [Rhizobium sp. Leaf384]KQS85922.1 citrate lyase [Rhizobium sp. Leaf383]
MSMSDRHPHRLRRSVLCVPADNDRALAKMASLSPDAVIYDLEDAVLPEHKLEARQALVRHLGQSTQTMPGVEQIVRINSLASGFGEADLQALSVCRFDAVLVPKVEGPRDILDIAEGWDEGDALDDLRLWAMIETPRGVLNVAAIAETGRTRGGRLDCLIPGLNDLRKETGVAALSGRTYLVPWLMQILLAARGSGLDALDAVFNDIADAEGFARECAAGRDMGFDGKMLIHPQQIAPANTAFGPSAAEEAEAREIVMAFDHPDNAGRSVIVHKGKMVETLHLDQALACLAKVEAIKRRGKPT